MARRAALGGAGLNPFGGTGVDFGAFDITGSNRESTLILTRVEVAWAAGQATNAEYLAALSAYAGTLTANTSERLNAEARVETVKYRVEREVLSAQVEAGTKTLPDLLAYDQSKLAGLKTDSEEYLQRQNVYQATQSRYYSELERPIVQSYNDGQMTTAQLNAWYAGALASPELGDNKDIRDNITTRQHDLTNRLTQERDSKMFDDYNQGRVTPATFGAYATAAQARYVPGSQDFQDWGKRVTDAHDKALETQLLYRYDLSQQYAQLAKFVADSKAPTGYAGGTSTSHQTRTVLGADNQWHTVTTTSTKATAGHGPTAAEQKAYKQRQVEVSDAKRQMTEITAKIGSVGGFTSTDSVITYYQGQAGKFAKGSAEWYAVQGKLDSLNDRKHAEIVLAKQGIRISYPSSGGGGGATASKAAGTASTAAVKSDTAGTSIDQFMSALAHVESHGSYTARNKSSGAYGKYQIMPANWAGWAAKYLGNANAAQNPANQEKVAKGRITDYYKSLGGDWRAVAHAWLTGAGNKAGDMNPSSWSAASRKYVDNVMAGVGLGPTSGSSLQQNAAATAGPGGYKAPGSGSATVAPTAASKPPAGSPTGILRVITDQYQAPVTARTAGKYRAPGTVIPEGPATVRANLPKNMDSDMFAKFYASYERAFNAGNDNFTIDGTHYYLGGDNASRIDGMREMDALRIRMYTELRHAYTETRSEEQAANLYNSAVTDAVKHEIMTLDTDERNKKASAASPIASGLSTLDHVTAAINENLAAAKAALARGDTTTAYRLYQFAADQRDQAGPLIAAYEAAGRNAIGQIEQATGISAEQALGSGGANKLATDFAKYDEAAKMLNDPFDIGIGKDVIGTINKITRMDAYGDPLMDSPTPDGQLVMSPDYHWEIQGDGSVKEMESAPSGWGTDGKPGPGQKGFAHTKYRTGNTVVDAYIKYTLDTVGYIIQSDGQRVPIMGKTFTRKKTDGSGYEQWSEDPMNPGKWSSTAIVYKAPPGFKAIPNTQGGYNLEFSGLKDSGRGTGAMTQDGNTYKLEFDPTTGTYAMYRSNSGGLFGLGGKEDNVALGSIRAGPARDAWTSAGFARDKSGLSADDLAFADVPDPFVGGNSNQYKEWLTNSQRNLPERQRNNPAQQPTMDPMAPWLARSAGTYTPTGRAADDLALTRSPLDGKALDDLTMGGSTPPNRRLDTIDPMSAWLAKPTGPPPALKPLPTRSMQPTIDQPLPPSRQAATAAAAKTAAAQATADALAASRAATTRRAADAEARRRAAAAVALSSSVAPLAPAYTGSGPRRQTPL
jgi:hypothetical protein